MILMSDVRCKHTLTKKRASGENLWYIQTLAVTQPALVCRFRRFLFFDSC